jgi:hypothetical protein
MQLEIMKGGEKKRRGRWEDDRRIEVDLNYII